jgi:electron transfer flavoprotein beta subunit
MVLVGLVKAGATADGCVFLQELTWPLEGLMKILVTAKRVEDPNAKLEINSDGSWIEDDVEYILNPFCENAIECALQLAEANDDVETVAIGIGDEEVQRYIRQGALARGIDRGIHVDAEEAELDSDVIARILKGVVEEEEPDLILLGKQAVDGDSNQVSQLLAEYLQWPQATFASEVSIEGNEVIVTREVDGGLETLALEMPAVVSADLRGPARRPASICRPTTRTCTTARRPLRAWSSPRRSRTSMQCWRRSG